MGAPRRRKSDDCMMIKWWDKYGAYWQIFTPIILGAFFALVAGIWWVKDVSDYKPRLEAVEDKVEKIPVMAQKIDGVSQRVEDIANFIGVSKRR